MTTTEFAKLKLDVERFAAEESEKHILFTSGNYPAWAKGHESELNAVFTHYAKIGASEALNHLRRNSLI